MVHYNLHRMGKNKVVAPHGASIRMSAKESDNVPRTPEEPTPKQVYDQMSVCEPYTVSELEDAFEDASRWTIQRRLETLLEEGKISKKKHAENRVSYWVPASESTSQ
jgi:predicted HTH transcriptional regulator